MIKNNISRYGLIAKLFHWVTFFFLIVHIPFGVYISNLEFSSIRYNFENYHALSGIIIFYIVLARLIWKFFNPTPKLWSKNKLQALMAKTNHFLLYLFIFIILLSDILKKFFMGEPVNLIFFNIQNSKTMFVSSNFFYELYWWGNIILVTLILIHILAAIYSHIILKKKILKKII